MRFSSLLAGLFLSLLVPLAAPGSGSYPGRPPQPPGAIDSSKYNLGKQIFAGKARLGPPASDTSQQRALLDRLQASLPAGARKKAKLPELAGQLSADQLSALEYYLKLRYRVK